MDLNFPFPLAFVSITNHNHTCFILSPRHRNFEYSAKKKTKKEKKHSKKEKKNKKKEKKEKKSSKKHRKDHKKDKKKVKESVAINQNEYGNSYFNYINYFIYLSAIFA